MSDEKKIKITFNTKLNVDCLVNDDEVFDDLDNIMNRHKNFIKISNTWLNLDSIKVIEILGRDKEWN